MLTKYKSFIFSAVYKNYMKNGRVKVRTFVTELLK